MRCVLAIETLDFGGAERVVHQLALQAQAVGDEAIVYCLRHSSADTIAPLEAAGVCVRQAYSVGFDPLLPLKLLGWMLRDRPDVIHAHAPVAAVMLQPAAQVLRIPLVQTRHGELFGANQRYPRLANRLARFLSATTIVAESLRRTLPTARQRREAVLTPNGLERPRLPRRLSSQLLAERLGGDVPRPLVLAIGAICREKDPLMLVRAMARLRGVKPEAQLVWAGPTRDAAYFEQVQSEAARLGLTDAVHWIGAVPEAWRLLAAGDVFVLSSATEAMPLVVIEAMSQHTPIVATAVGDVGQLPTSRLPTLTRTLLEHGETALLTPPGDADALADAVRETLRDRDAARHRATAALRVYEREYTAASMYARVRRVYERVTHLPGATRRRPRVLLLGPRRADVGGISSAVTDLMEGPLRKHATLRRFEPSRSWPIGWRANRWQQWARVVPAAVRHLIDLLRLGRTVVRTRADIAHVHTCQNPTWRRDLLNMLVVRLLGARVVTHIHGSSFDQFCAHAGWIDRLGLRFGAALSDRIIVLSPVWRDTLRGTFPVNKLRVAANAVNRPSFKPIRRRPTGPPVQFLFLSQICKRKGVDTLLEAAAHLPGTSEWELELIGPADEAELAGWRKRAATLGLASRVRFAPAVTGDAKWSALADADVFVLPSRHEGMPLVLLEAGLVGLPIITTTVGAIPEMFATHDDDAREALLVPAGCVPSLSHAMCALLVDAELRATLASRGRQAVERFTPERLAGELAAIYREVSGLGDVAGVIQARSAPRPGVSQRAGVGSPPTRVEPHAALVDGPRLQSVGDRARG